MRGAVKPIQLSVRLEAAAYRRFILPLPYSPNSHRVLLSLDHKIKYEGSATKEPALRSLP